MAGERTKALVQKHDSDGTISARAQLTSTSDQTRCSMTVPPSTVVPVVFVPGIMGSNLRNRETCDSVWNVNSTTSIALQWAFRSAKTRQQRLCASDVEVDTEGEWYGKSATVADKATGLARGQGMASKAFYGDFVRWLDDMLNSADSPPHGFVDTAKSYAERAVNWVENLFDSDEDEAQEGCRTPWHEFESRDLGEQWGSEKPFDMLTESDASDIWDKYYCPVHVVGYNWLLSNGASGEYLSGKIDEIIELWNTRSRHRDGGPKTSYTCEKVILVSHSMGGLVTRASVSDDVAELYEFASASDKVLGIVHGEQPANGAAAAYHHCRSGYGGFSSLVLGRNAAQVTAVFANSAGAMELLPNHQYPKGWLKAATGARRTVQFSLPQTDDPYYEIYLEKDCWWRLVDTDLIDPAGKFGNAWLAYTNNVTDVFDFQCKLAKSYHDQTYVHYGADDSDHPAYGDIVWAGAANADVTPTALREGSVQRGSNPVTMSWRGAGASGMTTFSIVDPDAVGYPQPGDGTVPACSGAAPHEQGGGSVRQSFRLTGFDHQESYDDDTVRNTTLYAIGMLLKGADQS